MLKLYPMLFSPVLKDYLWGGRNLKKFGRKLPDGVNIAESWEISGHPDGETKIINGFYSGKTLNYVLQDLGIKLIGRNNSWALKRHKFPLLVKLLDADKPLSVQVHPNDDFARRHEANELGKFEMWVVLEAKPGSEIIYGVTAGTTPQNFREALDSQKLEFFLHHVRVKKGDHICVPAGTLHAILGGIVLLEIQQNSNTTYRVYDWNRISLDGSRRQLHIDKAMQVINFDQVEPSIHPPHQKDTSTGIIIDKLCANPYFTTERIIMEENSSYSGNCNGDSLEIIGLLGGKIQLQNLIMDKLNFCLLPASMGKYSITALSDSTIIRTFVDKAGSKND